VPLYTGARAVVFTSYYVVVQDTVVAWVAWLADEDDSTHNFLHHDLLNTRFDIFASLLILCTSLDFAFCVFERSMLTSSQT
jgi:hypothetical protein